jgi:nucleotide sugar dehydrogenase|tara:strand:+ start:353 stop:1213 length:861 start_codon:yes stop_codon:yes gene_type:complete
MENIKHNVGIIGNGFVGSAVAHGFGLHANVKIYDSNPNRTTHTMSEVVNTSEFIFVSVPTPMKNVLGGSIDTTILYSVFEKISELNKRDDNIFIVKSTIVPGTMESLIQAYPGLNIVHSPEFLTERSARLDFINASRIILGGETGLINKVEPFLRNRFPHVKIIKTDVTTAQFIKYMANCFFSTKVSFMNEMKQAAEVLDVNWGEALNGLVSDGRIGNSHLDVPGHDGHMGFGGKCFPKDLNAFIGLFNKIGVEPKVMTATWEKNLEVRNEYDWKNIEGAVSKEGQ